MPKIIATAEEYDGNITHLVSFQEIYEYIIFAACLTQCDLALELPLEIR